MSDDVISLPEVYSAAVSPYGVEEDYSRMMAESIDFSEVFQGCDLLCAYDHHDEDFLDLDCVYTPEFEA